MINTNVLNSVKQLRYLKILGQFVGVKAVDQNELDSHFSDEEKKDSTYNGYYDEINRKIYILDSLDNEVYRRILLHEVAHAYLRMGGMQEVLEHSHEEMICTLAENLVELFRDESFVNLMQEDGI